MHFGTANVSQTRTWNEPKTAKFEEIVADFCVFKSTVPGLKLNFYEPYVDMPSRIFHILMQHAFFGIGACGDGIRAKGPRPFERHLSRNTPC